MIKRDTLLIKQLIAFICLFLSILFVIFFILIIGSAISPMIGNKDTVSINNLLSTILYTFKQSILSTVLAIIIGIPGAWYISKRKFFTRRFLLSLSAVPLCLPSLIMALGYISTFGMAGYFNTILQKIFCLKESPLQFLYTFWGIVITQGFYNAPLAIATISDSWMSLDYKEEEASLLLGSSKSHTFFSITIYKLLPSIMSCTIIIFLFCFFSFMIVLLFGAPGGTTLEVAIYHKSRNPSGYKTAAILSIIETLCALITVFIYSSIEQKANKNKTASFTKKISPNKKISKKEAIPFIIYIIIITVFLLIPLLSIVISSFSITKKGITSFSIENWKKLFNMKGFLISLKHTCIIGLGTACLSTIMGFTYSVIYRFNKKSSILLRSIPMIPMAISSVVTGLGIIYLVKYSTPFLLVIAQTILFWPFSFRQIYPALAKINQNTINASYLLQKSKLDTVFNIMIPYCKKNILSSIGFCFALSAGDATLPLILSLYNYDTLALYTYRLASSYKTNLACTSGLILSLICVTIYSLSDKLKDKRIHHER